MSDANRVRRVKGAGATILLATGLLTGGYAAASAASSSPSQPTSSTTQSAPSDGPRMGMMIAGATVTSFTPTSLVVGGPGGNTRTFTLTSSTKYNKDGAPAAYSDLAVGEHVAVRTTDTSPPPDDSSSTPHTAAEVNILSPSLAGTVQSVTGSPGSQTIVVVDPEGFWRTIQTSSSTTYTKDGSTVTNPTIATGSFLAAIGSIDADHTTLDASKVMLGRPTPGNGPFGSKALSGVFPGGPVPFGGGPGQSGDVTSSGMTSSGATTSGPIS